MQDSVSNAAGFSGRRLEWRRFHPSATSDDATSQSWAVSHHQVGLPGGTEACTIYSTQCRVSVHTSVSILVFADECKTGRGVV